MELMANALGLGVIFSGFSVRAVCSNQEIIELLGIDKIKGCYIYDNRIS